jgi:methylation protein EvaC
MSRLSSTTPPSETFSRPCVNKSDQCRWCGHPLEIVINLGYQPVAQAFILPGESHDRPAYELKPAVCTSCSLFQLVELPESETLFHAAYPYFTGTSQLMSEHFERWAEHLMGVIDGIEDPCVVEIGSNDGTFLCNIARRGIRHLGVEPAESGARAARDKGVTVVEAFFNVEVAQRILAEHGPADLIVGANVIAHIPFIKELAVAVTTLLKRDGLFTFEAIYLGDVIRNTALDQLYDEHAFIFSAQVVRNLFSRFGLEIIDLSHQATHGGSLRYVLAWKGRHKVSATVAQVLEEERLLRLDDMETYRHFTERCETTRVRLKNLVTDLHQRGHRIAGYGATAKSTTILNYAGIDSMLVEFIADNTSVKQGRLTPGTHIPIRSPEYFTDNMPDYTILLAWNHREEIERKEVAYRERGGKWIVYVPDVAVI